MLYGYTLMMYIKVCLDLVSRNWSWEGIGCYPTKRGDINLSFEFIMCISENSKYTRILSRYLSVHYLNSGFVYSTMLFFVCVFLKFLADHISVLFKTIATKVPIDMIFFCCVALISLIILLRLNTKI